MRFELQRWADAHRDGFAAMLGDPEVMADQGGPIDRDVSMARFDAYRDAWDVDGISRWVVADPTGGFLGYVGVSRRADADHPLGVHHEIGWRLCRHAWGRGLATESARMALAHAWTVLEAAEILAYTAAENQRSQCVMGRLSFRRDSARDFVGSSAAGGRMVLLWCLNRPDAPDLLAST